VKPVLLVLLDLLVPLDLPALPVILVKPDQLVQPVQLDPLVLQDLRVQPV
jgi:hypothetical protein